jgi:hypothetical protein
MRGLVRPCRHEMSSELRERWRGHLCGLCLTLRDEGGQSARVLTGYDVLLLSVLVEAQTGRLPSTTAGPCVLRGMRTATVIRSDTPAMQLAAAGSLLAGAAGLADKVSDRDIPGPIRPAARAMGRRLAGKGKRLANQIRLPTQPVLEAPTASARLEAQPAATLTELLTPAGLAVAELFAHTAAVAGCPGNETSLRKVGDAFGRLVHLVDAVDDLDADRRNKRFNPLTATTTNLHEARAFAERLRAEITTGLHAATFADRELLDVLLGPVLDQACRRTFGDRGSRTAAPFTVLGIGLGVATAGVFGGPFGRRRRRSYDPRDDPRYNPNYDYDPRYAGYGRRSRRRGGMSCCDILACDCCANMACGDLCGGDCCVCCC